MRVPIRNANVSKLYYDINNKVNSLCYKNVFAVSYSWIVCDQSLFALHLTIIQKKRMSSLKRSSTSLPPTGLSVEKKAKVETPHLQGYFQLRKRAYIRQLRDLFSPRCHYEVARGTPKQNRAYCSKDGDFREGGEFPCRGKEERRNREEIAARFSDAVGRGAEAVREFAEEFPGTWYGSGFNMLRNAQLVMPPIHRPEINVQWLHGKPGVGKSRRAHEQLPEAYIKEPRTKWWNGYMYEKEVIIDDFGPGGIDINHLLSMVRSLQVYGGNQGWYVCTLCHYIHCN